VLYNCSSSDVVLVETRPATLERSPSSTAEILSRVVSLSARAALIREMRMIDFISDLVRKTNGQLLPCGVREVRLHRVAPNPALAELGDSGGFRVDLGYFHRLFELGREAASSWLQHEL
jgi:NTE family protein